MLICICLWLQYIYIFIRFEEYMSVEFIFWYQILVTKCTFCNKYMYFIEYLLPTFWRIYVSWRFSVRPLGAGLGNVHFVKYIFLLDICGQHLGDICLWEVFCAPFGRRIRRCTCWIIFIFVLDICCQHLGNKCKLIFYISPRAKLCGAQQSTFSEQTVGPQTVWLWSNV